MVFPELWRETGTYSRVIAGMALQPRVCSATSGLLSSCEGYLGILLKAWQSNRDASLSEAGDPDSLSSCHRHIGIPINF